jgi:hypothetical protein
MAWAIRGRRLLRRDNAGQMTLEWALVLAAFALPMFFVIRVCMNVLVAHFQMVTFLETLPFP